MPQPIPKSILTYNFAIIDLKDRHQANTWTNIDL